jgi:hypothetical protein
MLVFVLHFYFGLNFQFVLFWFFIFGIVNHIAILAMLVVTLYYTPSNLPFLFELYVDSKTLWKFVTKRPFMIYILNWGINCPTVTWPFTSQFNNQLNIIWMILLFKACYEFGPHCLCHCATSSLITLGLKCRNPTFGRVWGWDSHFRNGGLGVLWDSQNFRVGLQGSKHLALGCSLYHWKAMKV